MPETPPPSARRKLSPQTTGRLVAALALIACIIAYIPGLSGPLFFDDLPNLSQNPQLEVAPTVFDSWRAALVSNESGILRRPAAMFTFAINHAVAGEWSPGQLKATNLALHLLIALILYHWFLLLLRAPALASSLPGESQRRGLALLAAAIWLLHPLHVSTVLYAVQRMAQLSALFVVFGLWLYTRFRLQWASEGATTGRVIAAGLWLLLVTALAAFSKENGALLLWLVAVVEVFLFRGIWAGRDHATLRHLGWFALLLPVLLVVLAFVLDPGLLDARYSRREFSLPERLLTQLRLLWQYLAWTVFPDITALGFHHDDIPVSTSVLRPLTTVAAFLAWAVVTVGTLVLRQRLPLVAFALFFYLVAHSMESSFWPLEMVYEHRNYLPSMVLCLLLAAALYAAATRLAWLHFAVTSAVVLLALTLTLALRAGFWGDEIALARHNVINHPKSPRAQFFYANSLFKALERREELGLSEQERTAYLVTARKYFMQMHTLNPREYAALVMLYQIDNTYFAALPERPDWLARMRELAADRRLQSSDRTALEALARFAIATPDPQDDREVLSLLDVFPSRYADSPDMLLIRYRLATAAGDDDFHEQLGILQKASARRPGDLRIYPHLVQHQAQQDLPESYESVLQWMAQDTLRRDLLFIRRLFARPPR